MIPALRHALCPLPSLAALLAATSRGQLDLAESPRQRQPQLASLSEVLPQWLLG